MKNRYNKTYFEIYAALTLLEIGYIDCNCIDIIVDRPDIQCNGIGIEVTRDIPQLAAQQTNYFNKVSGEPKNKKLKILQKIDRNRISNLWDTEDYNFLMFNAWDDSIIKQVISKKNKKIGGYDKNNQLDLYIFTSTFDFDTRTSKEVTEFLFEIESDFDSIFIMSHATLFKYSEGITMKYEFNFGRLKHFKSEANRLNYMYFDSMGNRLR